MDRFLSIIEMYESIQGEGLHSGLPCFFIRTAGCDLRCSWCDTPYSWTGGNWAGLDSVIEAVPEHISLVQITGGEPLLQKERVSELCHELNILDKKILLETGGHRSIKGLPDYLHIVMDVKLPKSGEDNHDFVANIQYLKKSDEVKFVIADRTDYEAAVQFIKLHSLERLAQVLLSPVHGVLKPDLLAEWMLKSRITARMQLQMHKYIWGAGAKGV